MFACDHQLWVELAKSQYYHLHQVFLWRWVSVELGFFLVVIWLVPRCQVFWVEQFHNCMQSAVVWHVGCKELHQASSVHFSARCQVHNLQDVGHIGHHQLQTMLLQVHSQLLHQILQCLQDLHLTLCLVLHSNLVCNELYGHKLEHLNFL